MNETRGVWFMAAFRVEDGRATVTARVLRPLLVLLTCAILSSDATAETTRVAESRTPDATFPLGEHYRIGRYLPVFAPVPNGKTLRITVTNAVSTVLTGETTSPVPLLSVQPLGDVSLLPKGGSPIPRSHEFRSLAPDERLVGVATDASDAGDPLNELFPSESIVRVPLGRIAPLPGSALAWGSLDAVLFDAATAARITAQQLETLRAAGVSVAIRVDARPTGDWAWQRRGAWWALPPDESAVVQVVQPDRYAPAGELAAGSRRFRQVMIASLACFAIAAVAASLWRSRREWLVVIAISLVAAAAISFWNVKQPKSATVVTEETSDGWLDRYTQHIARADGDIRHAIPESAAASWPILFSPNHARDVDLALECRADGTPLAFVAHLKRGQSIVFLDRAQTKRGHPEYPSTRPAK